MSLLSWYSKRHPQSRIGRWWIRKDRLRNSTCPHVGDVPLRDMEIQNLPSWPPVPQSFPVSTVREIFAINGEMIHKLCLTSTLNDHELTAYLMPVLTQLAKAVHLLPASEYEHHQGIGGLFKHSLEVAFFCANRIKQTSVPFVMTPAQMEANSKRWVLSAILAGLLHDPGKAFTDMRVTLPDGSQWQGNWLLFDWLVEKNALGYYVSFVEGRVHKSHCEASLQLMNLIVPQTTLDFLAAGGFGNELITGIRDAVLHGSEGGILGKVLTDADAHSVKLDVKRQREIAPMYKNVAHPQADMVLRVIRSLINSGTWTVNQKDSRVFVTDKGVFIEWTIGSQEIRTHAIESGIQSLPSDPLSLASIMVKSSAAVSRQTEDMSSPLWTITPFCLKDVSIAAIKVASSQIIFDRVPGEQMACIVKGEPIDTAVQQLWLKTYGIVPVETVDPVQLGYSPELLEEFTSGEILVEETPEGELVGLSPVVESVPDSVPDKTEDAAVKAVVVSGKSGNTKPFIQPSVKVKTTEGTPEPPHYFDEVDSAMAQPVTPADFDREQLAADGIGSAHEDENAFDMSQLMPEAVPQTKHKSRDSVQKGKKSEREPERKQTSTKTLTDVDELPIPAVRLEDVMPLSAPSVERKAKIKTKNGKEAKLDPTDVFGANIMPIPAAAQPKKARNKPQDDDREGAEGGALTNTEADTTAADAIKPEEARMEFEPPEGFDDIAEGLTFDDPTAVTDEELPEIPELDQDDCSETMQPIDMSADSLPAEDQIAQGERNAQSQPEASNAPEVTPKPTTSGQARSVAGKRWFDGVPGLDPEVKPYHDQGNAAKDVGIEPAQEPLPEDAPFDAERDPDLIDYPSPQEGFEESDCELRSRSGLSADASGVADDVSAVGEQNSATLTPSVVTRIVDAAADGMSAKQLTPFKTGQQLQKTQSERAKTLKTEEKPKPAKTKKPKSKSAGLKAARELTAEMIRQMRSGEGEWILSRPVLEESGSVSTSSAAFLAALQEIGFNAETAAGVCALVRDADGFFLRLDVERGLILLASTGQ